MSIEITNPPSDLQPPQPKLAQKKSPKQQVLDRLPEIQAMAEIQCTDTEIAHIIGVSEATLQRYASEALCVRRAAMRKSLRRLQLDRCEAGDTKMLIWLGQQYLGQRREHRIEAVAPPLYDGPKIAEE